MPASITRSCHILRSQQEVSATLADFAGLAQWARSVDHSSTLTEPASGLGAARRVQVGRMTVIERVVEWELPATLAYVIEGLPTTLGEVVNRWRLTEVPDGTVEVELTTTVCASGTSPGRMIDKVATRVLARTSDKLLADLSAHLGGTKDAVRNN